MTLPNYPTYVHPGSVADVKYYILRCYLVDGKFLSVEYIQRLME